MSGATNLIPEVSFRVNENLIGSSRRNLSQTYDARIIFLALLDRRKAQTIVRTSAAKTGRGQGAAPISKSVLISGIGIAGPTLAYWLSAWGYRPTLTERAAAPRTDGYIIELGQAEFVKTPPAGDYEPQGRCNPRCYRDPQHRERYRPQGGKISCKREPQAGDRIHPKRENDTPKHRGICQGRTAYAVLPDPKEQQQRNPPSSMPIRRASHLR